MEQQRAYEILKKGIASLDFEGSAVPSELLLTGDEAFPVVVNGSHQVLIAASRYGKGRLVALGHESYLESPKFAKFLVNAVTWLRQGAPRGHVSVIHKLEGLKKILDGNGIKAGVSEKADKSAAVHCMTTFSSSTKEEEELSRDLVAFVKSGGGLLIGGQAWNWGSHNKGKDAMSHFPANKISGVAGVYFMAHTGNKGVFKIKEYIPANSTILRQNIHWTNDYKRLVAGVTAFTVEGNPSQLVAHGSTAFPVVVDLNNRTLIAAARYGEGRVVVLSHEGQMGTEAMRPFILNAVRWLDAERHGKVGVSGVKGLNEMLGKEGFSSAAIDFRPGLSVFCCGAYINMPAQELHEFVAEGGGLMIGGHAWLWASKNPGKSVLTENPGNKIVNKFGISILGAGISGGSFTPITLKEGTAPFNVRYAACHLVKHLVHNQAGDPLELKKMSTCLMQDYMPLLYGGDDDDACFKPFQQVGRQIVTCSKLPPVGHDAPVQLKSTDGFLMALANAIYRNGAKVEKNMPNLGQKFPGMPIQKTAAKGLMQVTIDGNNHESECWRSTGLYAPPSETVRITVPKAHVKGGLQIQIGSHTDVLFGKKEPVLRHPAITRRFAVQEETLEVGSCWGGLIYVVVPKQSKLGAVDVVVDGAVQAPWFQLGKTGVADWQQTIRHYPAPWSEFENENVILTIPSTDARMVNNPESLMKLWNNIMQAVSTLSATPFPFSRPERFVADVQIVIGLMHSGYPIMLQVSCTKGIIDEKCMIRGMWASIHELGHNQQRAAWEFPPHTTEATANLWSTYVHETVLGIAREKAHSALQPAKRVQRIKDHLKKGSKLTTWSVWTCLETYLQLQEAFGWEAFMKIFAAYQRINTKGLDNKGKMNLWAETFSKQVNKNLVPFFQKWGLPITDDVAKKLGGLPEWKENPMLKYK
ncbi:TRPM8 channel-associated factor 2 [Petromyzon marinus]|uniref:TRPM8 channel-associated factor 2 n=1 Tax=Petromyzon marinus TaxID=7757 RepID=UPI003F70B9A3